MDSKDILKMSLDEVVYIGRNKSYGGFFLRQKYGRHVTFGVIGGLAFFGLLVSGPVIQKYLGELLEKNKLRRKKNEASISERI